ncbi:MAG: Holliday junction resolvase RuvX [Phycisphaeraceae bacterium]|nr:MAG: Holliday junction resolvase RuvX [Phycisphaeraceae bacterium]
MPAPVSRFLAIDLGDKRTGLAGADSITRIASPLHTIEIPIAQRDRLLDALAAAARDHEVTHLVLGLPINMDDTEGPRAKLARAFALDLHRRTNLPIHLHDERLTSAQADWSMARSGMTHAQKKARRDALAAAALLHDFLTIHPTPPPDLPPASPPEP